MSHWGTIFEDPSEQVPDCLRQTIREGRVVAISDLKKVYEELHPEEGAFVALEFPQTPVRFLSICQEDVDAKAITVVNGFPYLREGEPNVFEVLDLNAGHRGSEGTVECVSRDSESVKFFDPLFFHNKSEYVVGQKYEFSLAAIAYSLDWLENPEFEVDSGPALEMERQRVLADDPKADVKAIKKVKFSLAAMKCLIERETPGDAEFHTCVDAVEWFRLCGTRMCKMSVLLRETEEDKLRASLYASEHVLNGYQPQVGHVIQGVAWIQAWPMRLVPSDESWIDRASEQDAVMEGVTRFFEAREHLADLHPGTCALGGSLMGAGWDVTSYNKSVQESDVPDFLAERGGKQINVWVTAYFPDKEAPTLLSDDRRALLAQTSKERGQDAAFLTVKCKEVGDYYYFEFENHELIKSIFGEVSFCEASRKPGTDENGNISI